MSKSINEETCLLITRSRDSSESNSSASNSSLGRTANYESTDSDQVKFNHSTSQDTLFSSAKETTEKAELKYMAKAAPSLIFTYLMQYSLSVSSIFSVSHLGEKYLGAVSLAALTYNITGLGLFLGLATCLDTLCSQAYGSGNKHLVGIYFQRGTVMILMLYIPLFIFWWNSRGLLLFLIEQEEIVDLTISYLKVLSFGAPGFILFDTGKRYLQSQGIFNAGTYVLLLCAPINMILNYILVWCPSIGMGYLGAGVAVVITYWLSAILLFLYTCFIDGYQCWGGFDLKNAFKGWRTLIDLAIPGVIMLEAENLAFEILTLASARFGTTALAAQSIVSTFSAIIFEIPFATSIVASTRIGQYIGNGNLGAAEIATKVALHVSLIVALLSFSVAYFLKSYIAKAFTSDPEVLMSAVKVFPLVAINQFFDCPNIIAAGILRGQGRQKIGGILNLAAYYTIGIPLALFLAFQMNLGIRGLWIGLGVGVFTVATGLIYCVIKSDWESIVSKASGNMHV